MAIVTASTSCSDNSKEDNATIAFSTIRSGAAFRLENSAKDYGRDADLTYYDTAAIVLPTVIYNQDITALQDSIMAAAFDTVATDHTAAMRAAFGVNAAELGYQTTPIASTPDMQYSATGVTIIEGNVFSLCPSLLTYRITNYTMRPGDAHGMTVNRYITYSIRNARMIDLAYIFTPEGLRTLPGVIAAKAGEMKAQLGATEITALPSDGNFYIGLDDTIVFVYQPTEAASYSQGDIAVPFYPYQLSDYMTAEGLALFGLANS